MVALGSCFTVGSVRAVVALGSCGSLGTFGSCDAFIFEYGDTVNKVEKSSVGGVTNNVNNDVHSVTQCCAVRDIDFAFVDTASRDRDSDLVRDNVTGKHVQVRR